MSGHTPGPWRVIWNGGVGPNKRALICKPDGATSDEAAANARLIASAPDLLAACQMLVNSYMPERGAYALGELYEAREKAAAAIAKATAPSSPADARDD